MTAIPNSFLLIYALPLMILIAGYIAKWTSRRRRPNSDSIADEVASIKDPIHEYHLKMVDMMIEMESKDERETIRARRINTANKVQILIQFLRMYRIQNGLYHLKAYQDFASRPLTLSQLRIIEMKNVYDELEEIRKQLIAKRKAPKPKWIHQ